MANPTWDETEEIAGPKWEDTEELSQPGYLESAARGLAQGGSLGFADEITGAVESAFTDKPYEQARNESRANYKRAQEANPATYTTSEIGGGLATAFVPGANIAKGASLGKAALQAAALGAGTGAGYSDADNIKDLAIDTGIGAGIGGALGAGAHAASPYLQKGIEKFAGRADDLADRFGARAIGAERGTVKSLGMDKVKEAGNYARKNLLSPFASTDDLLERNAALKSQGGEMMGKAYQAIDDAGASTFNPLNVASKVDENIGDFYRSPINRGETNQLENTLESILMRGEGNIPLREAQTLKQELGKVANWKNNLNITDKEKMAREAYGIVSSQIDEAVEKGSEAINSAGLSDMLTQGKKLYSDASSAEKLLGNKQAREQGNKLLGLTDWSVLGAGTGVAPLTGGLSAPVAAAGVLAKKGLEKYGAQNASLGLGKVADALKKSPQMANLYNKNPQVFNTLAQKMEERVGGMKAAEKEKPFDQNVILQKTQGTKYSQSLQDAAKRGPQAVGATHFVLQSKDPAYRQMFLDNEGTKEEDFDE